MHRFIQTEPVWIDQERAAAFQGRPVVFPDAHIYRILLCARTDDLAAPYIYGPRGIQFLSEQAIAHLERGATDLSETRHSDDASGAGNE